MRRARPKPLIHEAESGAGELVLRAEEASGRLALAQRAMASAEEARRGADAERQRWAARAEALSEALDEARARAGARRLASVDGAVGALVELVQVDEGNEAAFEAAAGEALSAVLMQDEAAARLGLVHLAEQGDGGAVMPLELAGALATEPTRWDERGPVPARWGAVAQAKRALAVLVGRITSGPALGPRRRRRGRLARRRRPGRKAARAGRGEPGR